MAAPIPPSNAMTETTGVDFNQSVTLQEEEQMMRPADTYDKPINSQPLEVYLYYSKIEREREKNDTTAIADSPWVAFAKQIVGKKVDIVLEPATVQATNSDEKSGEQSWSAVTDKEKDNAYRALRVASWQAVFYLITTDILGFSSAPQAFNELGIGPVVLVYFFFYVLAVFAGQVIWRLYLSYDSSRYPVTCYADIGERTFGRSVRHIFNAFQSAQLLFNVALLIIGNGQTLVAMIEWKFCYLALNIFMMLVGMIGGQIGSLRNFAWFANCNVWLNIVVMIITVVGTYRYPPRAERSLAWSRTAESETVPQRRAAAASSGSPPDEKAYGDMKLR